MNARNTAANTTRYSLYQKLFFLYGLNLVDWLCTASLLTTGRFYEANPLMSRVLPHFLPTLLLKGVIPLGVTLLCALLFWRSRLDDSPLGRRFVEIGIVGYTLVNLWHVVNFVRLFTAG